MRNTNRRLILSRKDARYPTAETQPFRLLRRLPIILVSALLIASLGAQLGALHWFGDFLAMVADYYVLIAICLLAWFGMRRQWRWALLAGGLMLFNGWYVLDYARATAQPDAGGQEVRLLVYNIYHQNPDPAQIVAEVQHHNPDIVFLMEYSDAIQQQIEGAFSDYPYRLIRPSRMTMGLALFSRYPFEATTIHRAEATRIPVFEVDIRLNNRIVSFVGGHPWPPQPRWGALHRSQVAAISTVAEQAGRPLIVAGDFNAAPWTHSMRGLAERSQVRHIRGPLDLTKTWLIAPPFGLPLDHVLISDEWQVQAYTYGNPSGSDHLPLVIDMRVP
ncbi:MAG: endonuclease/exonuclease/phosphatase family protein [Oscillochloris sp.]|nr:endonuclease/exonuclease/phosphatase family protein [Oscillochloris sp.]